MNSLKRFSDPVYCLMRLFVGLMFACHGAQKILGWFTPPGKTPQPLDALGTLGGWIELVCGLLIAVGLITSIAAFVASGEMAVAFFKAHFGATALGWIPMVNRGELAVTYCWIFLFIMFYGAGRWSIDAMIRRGAPASPTPTP
jgi:putative oxidoreductase